MITLLPLVFARAAAFAVAGIALTPADVVAQAAGQTYVRRDECIEAGKLSAEQCEHAYRNARAEFEQKAPRYASRAACDAGWVPSSYQVGLTGKTVTPELYIAIGISGASQHMAGCSNSRNIVAINKDAGANIFKDARFGVTGDWQKVLPAFMEQLQELLG